MEELSWQWDIMAIKVTALLDTQVVGQVDYGIFEFWEYDLGPI